MTSKTQAAPTADPKSARQRPGGSFRGGGRMAPGEGRQGAARRAKTKRPLGAEPCGLRRPTRSPGVVNRSSRQVDTSTPRPIDKSTLVQPQTTGAEDTCRRVDLSTYRPTSSA